MERIEKLILDDFVSGIKNIPNDSIDFIFIDPPYGMIAPDWDKKIELDLLWKEFDRVGKENYVCAIFCCQPFTTDIINSNRKKFKYVWYWNKNQGTNFFHAKRMPIRKVEEICIFGGNTYFPQITDGHTPTNSAKGCSNGKAYHGKNKRDYEGGKTTRYPNNILNFKTVDNYKRLHPSQKPIDLCEYIIKTYTKENNIILDCFAGTGSVLVAAKNLNRNFIGIEKEKQYFDIAYNRLFNNSFTE